MLQIVLRADQFLLQVGQQLGVHGRIVGAQIVGLMNDAAAEQPTPDAVDGVAREPGILGATSQSAKSFARVAAGG